VHQQLDGLLDVCDDCLAARVVPVVVVVVHRQPRHGQLQALPQPCSSKHGVAASTRHVDHERPHALHRLQVECLQRLRI
jgi:hypothetical protein